MTPADPLPSHLAEPIPVQISLDDVTLQILLPPLLHLLSQVRVDFGYEERAEGGCQ